MDCDPCRVNAYVTIVRQEGLSLSAAQPRVPGYVIERHVCKLHVARADLPLRLCSCSPGLLPNQMASAHLEAENERLRALLDKMGARLDAVIKDVAAGRETANQAKETADKASLALGKLQPTLSPATSLGSDVGETETVHDDGASRVRDSHSGAAGFHEVVEFIAHDASEHRLPHTRSRPRAASGFARRSARSESFVMEATERRKMKQSADFERHLELGESKRVVEFRIKPGDLDVCAVDRQAGFSDWTQCLVSGSHLNDGKAKFSAEGAHGTVLRALWKRGINVAIKCLTQDIALGASTPRRRNEIVLSQEMKLFRDLHHPHLVSCYGIVTSGGIDRIVTELCTTPLDAFLENDDNWKTCGIHSSLGLGEPDTDHAGMTQVEIDSQKFKILHDLSLGMQQLHDLDVLNRDIKPGNILLDMHKTVWKICDFGEAHILKRPTLSFAPPQPWKAEYTHILVDAERLMPVPADLSELSVRRKGARHCCWMVPQEVLRSAELDGLTPWVPCPGGGFVYLFNDDMNEPDSRDCYFQVTGSAENSDSRGAHRQLFPEVLGPWGMASVSKSLELEIDMELGSYQLSANSYADFEELTTISDLGLVVRGHLSPFAEVTLTAGVPPDATHKAWAYQGLDVSSLSKKNKDLLGLGADHLDQDSGSLLSFLCLGGFVYLKVPDGEDIADGKVVAIRAVGAGLGITCRTGTIDRMDNFMTAAIASPEMWRGTGIGLESDIYAFGIVMWEVMTRLKAWHWITCPSNVKDMTICCQVTDGMRPVIPPGFSRDCQWLIRSCVLTDPGSRPTAREITNCLLDRVMPASQLKSPTRTKLTCTRMLVVPPCFVDWTTVEVPGLVKVGHLGESTTEFVAEADARGSGLAADLASSKMQGIVENFIGDLCYRISPVKGDGGVSALRIEKLKGSKASHYNEEDTRWLFQQVDEDNNDQLSKDEVRRLLQSDGLVLDDDQLTTEFSKMDSDASGWVSFKEFNAWRVADLMDTRVGAAIMCRIAKWRHEKATDAIKPGWKDPLKLDCTLSAGWLVAGTHKRGHLNWNTLGRFTGIETLDYDEWQVSESDAACSTVPLHLPSLILKDIAAPKPKLKQYVKLPGLFSTVFPAGKIGVMFKSKQEQWQAVSSIRPGGLADSFPEIRVGCNLIKINNKMVSGKTYKEAAALLKRRPVSLTWQEPLVSVELQKLGNEIVFGEQWPFVKRVQDTLSGLLVCEATGPVIAPGFKLLSVNDTLIKRNTLIRDAAHLLRQRPVTLVFATVRGDYEPSHASKWCFLRNVVKIMPLGATTSAASKALQPDCDLSPRGAGTVADADMSKLAKDDLFVLRGSGRWTGQRYAVHVADVRGEDRTVKVRYDDGGFKRFAHADFLSAIDTDSS